MYVQDVCICIYKRDDRLRIRTERMKKDMGTERMKKYIGTERTEKDMGGKTRLLGVSVHVCVFAHAHANVWCARAHVKPHVQKCMNVHVHTPPPLGGWTKF